MLPIMILIFLGIDRAAPPGRITGQFRLEKHSFSLGEPIFVEFSVFNGSNRPYHFFVGGDYRGTLRHERFSFSVKNEAGRDFAQKQRGNWGGGGTTILLEPGQKEKWFQLLNGWIHLLPPGHYRVHCQTRLADDIPLPPPEDPRERSRPGDIEQDLEFEITSYQREQILEAIRQLRFKESTWGIVTNNLRVQPKDLGWALEGLAEEFQTRNVRTPDEARFENDVLGALPQKWSDRYFLEYDLGYGQRNWISAEPYKDAWLSFSVLNNSNRPLPLRFMGSSLFVNGAEVEDWQKVLQSTMRANNLEDVVEPGSLIEVSIKCTEFLTKGTVWKFVWNVDGFSKYTQISYLEPWRLNPNTTGK